jgi:hypothetical protein
MATISDYQVRSARHRRSDALDFRLIYLTAFAVMLVAAVLERVLPWNLLAGGQAGQKSALAQAREAANTCATYALMG